MQYSTIQYNDGLEGCKIETPVRTGSYAWVMWKK